MLKITKLQKGLLAGLVLLVSLQAQAQQQGQYSQYMLNYFLINPAVAGVDEFIDVRSGYRMQWTGIEGAPRNYYISAHSPINKLHGRRPKGKKTDPHHVLGGMVTGQKMNILAHNSAYLSYAYHMPITRDAILSFGAMAGVSQFSINRDDARFADATYDPAIVGKNQTKFDANIGIWFYTPKFFAGISTVQITESKMDFSPGHAGYGVFNRHYYLTGGYRLKLDKYWTLIPSVLAKATAGATQVDINAKLRFRNIIWGGVSYRRTDAVAAMAGIGIPLDKTRPGQRHGNKTMLEISYSYDLTTSRLNKASYGSHEIMVGIRLPNFGKRIASPSDYW